MRASGIFLSRHHTQAILREVDPVGVDRRLRRLERRRDKRYLTPGPNYIWSIDGHLKLQPYGIEIYACIDAFSRNIIWTYVGHTARTALSVVNQYLNVVESQGYIPQIVRSDYGSETLWIADTHVTMVEQAKGGNVEFNTTWWYSKSTDNVRIESWWQQLSARQLGRWRTYFFELKETRQYEDTALNRITLAAIFVRYIRQEVGQFVHLWNTHTIRKQKDRPYLVTGKPWVLHANMDGEYDDYRIDITPDQLAATRDRVPVFDVEQYLPERTLAWCETWLKDNGYSTILDCSYEKDVTSGQHLFHHAYCALREAVYAHAENQPGELHELPNPRNARAENVRGAQGIRADIRAIVNDNLDHYGLEEDEIDGVNIDPALDLIPYIEGEVGGPN